MSISSSSQKAVLPFLSFIFQIRPLSTVFSRRPRDPHPRGKLERLTPALVLSKGETQKVLVSGFNFSYCCWILFSSCSLVLLLWWRCASKPLKHGFTRSCPEPISTRLWQAAVHLFYISSDHLFISCSIESHLFCMTTFAVRPPLNDFVRFHEPWNHQRWQKSTRIARLMNHIWEYVRS